VNLESLSAEINGDLIFSVYYGDLALPGNVKSGSLSNEKKIFNDLKECINLKFDRDDAIPLKKSL